MAQYEFKLLSMYVRFKYDGMNFVKVKRVLPKYDGDHDFYELYNRYGYFNSNILEDFNDITNEEKIYLINKMLS